MSSSKTLSSSGLFNLGVVMAFEVTSHYPLFVPLTLPVIYTLSFHLTVFLFRLIEFSGNG